MPFQPLFKDIFDRSESDAGAAAMLQQLTKEHPYFSLAHFFLLKQADTNDKGYTKIAAKTALHFNNTFLLQNQLDKEREIENASLRSPFSTETTTAVPVLEEAIAVSDDAEPEVEENTEVEVADIVEEPAAENIEEESHSSFEAGTTEDISEASEVTEIEEPVLSPEQNVVAEAEATVAAENIEIAATENIAADTELPGNKTDSAEPAPFKMPTLGLATAPVEGSLLFTPLFATDYFASQGIKLRDEALPNDKLGKQLKSFTDWLKTMKKVNDSKLPAGSEVMDISVQKLAENSNKEEEVITETMAEVFLQQGKLHKAKEIYEKLSLLNPSKIAFFAAKIDQIQQK